MAVDIKSLRIGSHINLCGKMQRITAIDSLNGQIGIDAYKEDADGVKYPFGYKAENADPIPLTPELLKEMGFELKEIKDFGHVWGHVNMEIVPYEERLQLLIDNKLALQSVKYLHDLESLYYFIIGEELIKD